MSSHHIVREKQEPALLLLSLNNFSDELLGQLLEWSPTVITTPLVAEQVNAREIKIDIIVADEINDELQSDVKRIEQNGATSTGAAIQYLIQNDYKAVNIVTDIFELTAFEAFASLINIVIYSGNQKIFAVGPGFSKWKPAGEKIRILSTYVSLITSGLKVAGNNDYITIADGLMKLDFDNGLLFVAEEI